MKPTNTQPEGLVQKLESAKKTVLSQKDTIRIVSHYDADGICAAGVLCQALLRKDLKFHVKLTTSLKEDFIALLKEDGYTATIFCDMGSNNLPALSDLSEHVLIFDHHKPKEDSDRPLLVNPHFFGMDGTYEVCASSLVFMFALVLDQGNWDLSALALAGIIGDKQHLHGLSGYNASVVAAAEEKGFVAAKNTLKISGRNLKTALSEGLDPFLVGISGREERVLEFLRKLKLNPDVKLDALNEEQRRLLTSAVMVRILSQGARPDMAEGVVTRRYWLTHWNLYAGELSNYVNACGRMDNAGLGLALCLGDERALSQAVALRKAYKDELRQGLLKLEAEGAHAMKNIQFFYTENPSLAGANAGLGMMYILDQEKPTFSLSVTAKETKVSSRGTHYLISRGLDLAQACSQAAEKVGGKGGGHPIASGATVPLGKEEPFLTLLDEIVGEQLHGQH